MTATSTPTSPQLRVSRIPSAPALIGTVYAICVLGLMAVMVGDIVFSDKDPHRSQGPIESLISIGVVGNIALLIGVGAGLWLVRSAERARVGAIVFGVLSVLSLVVFWSGAPGIFGAVAAWLAGITRGGRPLTGAARIAGLVGIVIAVLNVVVSVGGVLLSAI